METSIDRANAKRPNGEVENSDTLLHWQVVLQVQQASTLLGGVSARYTGVSHAERVDVFLQSHSCLHLQ